ncbi:DUF3885 domain-containing protein [Paraclostridium bifermentans]|uniref:DUF3885 domain-containing protein n=1 Tax=Paraclostridium bifermentans TaxID=1490 RepID=UPI00359C52BA
MKSIESLENYMKVNLPNLTISMPLFYNSEIGIRFEIGDSNIDYFEEKTKYMNGVYMKSIVLFEEVFNPNTDIYIVVNASRWIDDEIDENKEKEKLHKYIKNKELYNTIEGIKLSYIYKDNDDEDESITFRYCLDCKLKDIKYRELLKSIGNQDMGIKPSFYDEVYFINKNENIIYHLYDDRGLDIVSSKAASIKHIYDKYNKWILDYDRKRINKTFLK